MTLHQIESFGLIFAMLVLFMSGRLRYDLVAALVLFVAVLLGVVPATKAFLGFANPVIIIIGSVLVVSRAIAASNVLELSIGTLLKRIESPSLQIGVLAASVGYLSAFVKNVGTLGIFIPVAIQTARRSGRPRSIYLMPLAFASLVGGTITKIGTSPNLLISTVRQELGQPAFNLFDFAAVGLPLTTIAVVFLAVGWRLLPHRTGKQGAEEAFSIDAYSTELRVPDAASQDDQTVASFEAIGEGEISVAAIIREGTRRYTPNAHWRIYRGDVLVVVGDPVVVDKVISATGYEIVGTEALDSPDEKTDELQVNEVIVTAESSLVGATPASIGLRDRYGVNLVAVRTAGKVGTKRLRSHRFTVGDVVLLQGWEKNLASAVSELGCLPLADRKLTIGHARNGLLPIAFLALALIGVALRWIDVEVAFFGAAVLTVLFKQISLKDTYQAIEWAGDRHARLLDPGRGRAEGNRRHRADRQLAQRGRTATAGLWRHRADHADRHAADTAAAPCGGGAGAGPGGGRGGDEAWLQCRSVPDGGGAGLRLRLPDADRASEQHAGDGPGWLPLR